MDDQNEYAAKCLIAAIVLKKLRRKKRREMWIKPWLLRRDLGVWNTLLQELRREDSESFKNFLRFSPPQFCFLLNLVRTSIAKEVTIMRSSFTKEERLSVTLRYLATGESFRSLSYAFRMSPSTVSFIIPEVCESLYLALKDTYLKVPSTPVEWEKIAEEFQEKWNFPNCVGALDGKHVVVQAPMNCGSYYYNYKNTHSIVLMALVDANYKFTYIDVGSNGRVSDGGVFKECSLHHAIEDGRLKFPEPKELPQREMVVPYVIVADEAFPLKDYILKPYPRRAGLDGGKRVFNYRLSRARRVVENAFGILCNRFRVLRSPILLAPDKVEKIVMCCCALHNFSRPETFSNYEIQDVSATDRQIPFPGNHNSAHARRIRDEFKEYFCTSGKVSFQEGVLD